MTYTTAAWAALVAALTQATCYTIYALTEMTAGWSMPMAIGIVLATIISLLVVAACIIIGLAMDARAEEI